MTDISFKLNDGHSIPAIGLGTWSPDDREKFQDAVVYAIEEAGYRHVDTAAFYQCEQYVGAALQKVFANGKVKREELFITTKVWPTMHNRVEQSAKLSLEKLGLDYVDLLLVHWPLQFKCDSPDGQPFQPEDENGNLLYDPSGSVAETWRQFEQVHAKGLTKSIGVSNFTIKVLEDLLPTAKTVPAVNQCELHVHLPQPELVKYCQDKGIVMTAYAPFGGQGVQVLKDPLVQELANKYKCSAGTIALSFNIGRGIVSIPKSFSYERIKANGEYVKLSEQDIAALLKDGETKNHRYIMGDPWAKDLFGN